MDPPVPPRLVGSVPTVIADASTNTPAAFTVKPAFATNPTVGFPETPLPFVTLMPFVEAIDTVVPVPVPVLTTIPFAEISYTVFALLAVPV
jgi:hypothetical protein